MSGWRLLLTRPAEENAGLAAALAAEGVASCSLPLLGIGPLPETAAWRSLIMALDHYPAVIVVSKPAARQVLALVDRYWPQPPLAQHWFALGPATSAVLADYGLDVSWPETGPDSEALLAAPALASALAVPEPRVLLVRGEGGRELLAETLRARGIQVDELILYRRYLPEYPAGILGHKVREHLLNGLVVSSGQSLQFLRELAAGDWPWLGRLTFFVPSVRVAGMARQMGAGNIVTCHGAGTPALLAALRATAAPAAS